MARFGSGVRPVFADVDVGMAGEQQWRFKRSERRVAIMAVARAVWTDASGAARELPARLEDTSRSGACIRIAVPISVDTRLIVDWRKERFSGVSRYCRADGGEYSVGIRRDYPEGTVAAGLPTAASPAIALPAAALPMAVAVAATSRVGVGPMAAEHTPEAARTAAQIAVAVLPVPSAHEPPAERRPVLLDEIRPEAMPGELECLTVEPPLEPTAISQALPPAPQPSRIVVFAPPEPHRSPQRNELSNRRERTKRTNMFSKFFSSKQDAKSDSNGSPNGASSPTHEAPVAAPRANEARPRVKRDDSAGPQGSLLPLEDIYRATGLIDLRTGYNIQKVVEMLDNSHIRSLPDETRRASILMALDAAGIPIESVLKDARLRLEALSKYESEQQKRLQEYEAQKLQENAAIQTELEQVTKHYQERMKSNLDDVAQQRDPFVAWQSTKEQEVQRVSEAVSLCSKRAETGSAAPAAELRPVAVPTTPVAQTAATSPQTAMKI